jgi:hypothetical protein
MEQTCLVVDLWKIELLKGQVFLSPMQFPDYTTLHVFLARDS